MEIQEPSRARTPRMVDLATSRPRRLPAAPADAPADRIELSSEGRSLAGVDDLTRARRVAELRARIDAGAYTVDAATLARHLSELGEA